MSAVINLPCPKCGEARPIKCRSEKGPDKIARERQCMKCKCRGQSTGRRTPRRELVPCPKCGKARSVLIDRPSLKEAIQKRQCATCWNEAHTVLRTPCLRCGGPRSRQAADSIGMCSGCWRREQTKRAVARRLNVVKLRDEQGLSWDEIAKLEGVVVQRAQYLYRGGIRALYAA